MRPQMKGLVRGLAICAILVALGVAAALFNKPRSVETRSGEALVGGAFTLLNTRGETVTEADYRGQYMLLYFGYTYCPDVCPAELQAMAAGLALFEKTDPTRAAKIRPVLITIDPERDTPEILKAYVPNFHPRLEGLTGTPAQVKAAEKAWRVYAQKNGEGKDYLMDHTSMVYLMAPDGSYVTVFGSGTAPEDIAKGLGTHVQ